MPRSDRQATSTSGRNISSRRCFADYGRTGPGDQMRNSARWANRRRRVTFFEREDTLPRLNTEGDQEPSAHSANAYRLFWLQIHVPSVH